MAKQKKMWVVLEGFNKEAQQGLGLHQNEQGGHRPAGTYFVAVFKTRKAAIKMCLSWKGSYVMSAFIQSGKDEWRPKLGT